MEEASARFQAALPPRLEVGAGAAVTIDLPSAGGSGYLWTVEPAYGHQAVADVDLRVGPRPQPQDPPTNASSPVALVVTGRTPGSRAVRLRLARPFDPDQTLCDQLVEVVVIDTDRTEPTEASPEQLEQ
jgi:hypothetical protein